MGETQIYNQRLFGITEKRRLLGEVDRIERELELQKLKLQQLKRKSLRERWLMEGLAPAPCAETENPLSETEDKIKQLEDELESFQLQLVYLENPELKIENLKKQQGPNTQLINGDRSQQNPVEKDPIHGKREVQEKHKVIEEDVQPNGESEKQGEVVVPSQKDSKDVVVGHPVPAPRGIRVSANHLIKKNQDETSPDRKTDIMEKEHDTEMETSNHSLKPQNDEFESLSPNEELKDGSLDQEHTDQDVLNQNSNLDKRLRIEEENIEHLTKELEHKDLSFNAESLKSEVSQLNSSNENMKNDLDSQHNLVKVTLLEESDQNENETQPSPVVVNQYESQDEPLVRDNSVHNSQDVEEKQVSVSIIQDDQNHDQNEESALPKCQEEPVEPVLVLIGHDKKQDLESTSFPLHQSLVLMSSDQEQSTKPPCNDQVPSVSLPCEDLVSQVQISQVMVITTPGPPFSEEPAHHSSQHGPSANHHYQPGTTEASMPAENQPLLHKQPETDAQLGPQGSNTAETRDKSTPGKKKSCQCCVIM
ncbi:paralemmin-3 [Ranitomeya variabilis]|uniref:paralemmin-3 n=1 Tax=Ranitomeya variabilis TaxID=490064 RepID=UPI00405625A7